MQQDFKSGQLVRLIPARSEKGFDTLAIIYNNEGFNFWVIPLDPCTHHYKDEMGLVYAGVHNLKAVNPAKFSTELVWLQDEGPVPIPEMPCNIDGNEIKFAAFVEIPNSEFWLMVEDVIEGAASAAGYNNDDLLLLQVECKKRGICCPWDEEYLQG
jgi:hypothetical protein